MPEHIFWLLVLVEHEDHNNAIAILESLTLVHVIYYVSTYSLEERIRVLDNTLVIQCHVRTRNERIRILRISAEYVTRLCINQDTTYREIALNFLCIHSTQEVDNLILAQILL